MKKIYSIVLTLSFLLTACGGSPAASTKITMLETDFQFSPGVVLVPLGQSITITFVNNGQTTHDFAIVAMEATEISGNTSDSSVQGHTEHASEYVIHVATTAGGSSTVVFTPQKAGQYEFICTVDGHKEAGMLGTLIVVASE